MYLPVEPGRLIGGRKIEDALYFDFGLKSAVVSCLTNALAPPPIVPESYSKAQMNRTVF